MMHRRVVRILLFGLRPVHSKSNREILKKLITFSLLIFLLSCDCVRRVNGVLVDKATGKAVVGASISDRSKPSFKTISDSSGRFELSDVSGGLFGCPEMQILVSAKGYPQLAVSIPAGGSKRIELER